MDPGSGAVELYWLPLGAGGHVVRRTGRVYEVVSAWRAGRQPQDVYHSALVVTHDGTRHVIEMAPVWNLRTPERGVVREGPVGVRAWGRWAAFRYEVRCWPGGTIPDVDEAVDSPQRLSETGDRAARVLELVPEVPDLTWGRDEWGLGDMWNSNSLVSWLLARSGHDLGTVVPPGGGRAPGWAAGLALAARQSAAGPEPRT